jgi:autotransporter-associated beta strand protein
MSAHLPRREFAMLRASRNVLDSLLGWLRISKPERLLQLRQCLNSGRLAVSLILALFVVGVSTVPMQAAALYWDVNGGTLGSGDAGGSWSGTNWNTDSTGGSGGTISTWSSSNNAVLSAGTDAVGSFAISVTGAETVGNLTAVMGNVTLSGTGSFSLFSSATWTTNSGASLVVQPGISTAAQFTLGGSGNATYAGVISGIGGLSKTGSGLVTLQGPNTFTGATTISGGTVNLSNANALQFSTLQAPSAASLVFDQSVGSGVFNIGGLSGSGSLALKNNAFSPAPITLSLGSNGGSTTYSGILSDCQNRYRNLDPRRDKHLHGRHDHQRRHASVGHRQQWPGRHAFRQRRHRE